MALFPFVKIYFHLVFAQLRNAIHDLTYGQLGQLHALLIKMRKCKGSKECTYRHRNKISIDSLSGKNLDIVVVGFEWPLLA